MDKKIKNIEKDYMAGMKYSKIINKHKITRNRLEWLIQKYQWKRESNRSEVQKGNKNAVGNKGGPGAEKGNKRALKTGEYESILENVLTEEEMLLYNRETIDKSKELVKQYNLLSVRESRILTRIENLKSKEKELIVTHISKKQLNGTSTLKGDIDEIETNTETENKLDTIQRLEESLTRVQEAKRRLVDSMEKIDFNKAKLDLEERKLKQENNNLNDIEDLTGLAEMLRDDK